MRSSASDSSHRPSPGPASTAPPSPTRCSRLAASLYVAIEQIQNRRLGRCHREVPPASSPPRPPPASPSRVASAPGPWLARIAPYASLFRRMRERGPPPGSIRPKCMLFEIKMATSSPYASISGRNRAIRDAWRVNLAAKGPLSRRGTRNHARREDVASAARPFRGSGLRSGRTGFAPCGAGLACLPHAPPCHLACACRPRSSPPSICVALHRPHRAHPRPATRCISPCRVGPAAVLVIPAKWCGDTIAHTRKLRF